MSKYKLLEDVLEQALQQASTGKGKVRHATNNEAFEDQIIMWIEKNIKSFQLGQAVKKIHESQNLAPYEAVNELLGAIVFISAKIILIEKGFGGKLT